MLWYQMRTICLEKEQKKEDFRNILDQFWDFTLYRIQYFG